MRSKLKKVWCKILDKFWLIFGICGGQFRVWIWVPGSSKKSRTIFGTVVWGSRVWDRGAGVVVGQCAPGRLLGRLLRPLVFLRGGLLVFVMGPKGPSTSRSRSGRSVLIPKGILMQFQSDAQRRAARRRRRSILGFPRYAGSTQRNELRRSRLASSPEEVWR